LTSLRLCQNLNYYLLYSSLSLDILYGLLTATIGAPSYMIWYRQRSFHLRTTESVPLHILPTVSTIYGGRRWRLDWVTAPQAGRSQVRFQTGSLEVFNYFIFPVAIWSWGRLSL